MSIRILKEPIFLDELKEIAKERYGDLVKAVVDVSKEIIAIGPEMHADAEAILIEEHGADRQDTWGINLYPDADEKDWIEFDSLINLKPNLGNKSRSVEDPATQDKIKNVVKKYIKR